MAFLGGCIPQESHGLRLLFSQLMKIYKCWQWWWIQDGVDLTASGGSSEGSNVLQVRGRQAVISHLVRLIFHDFITPALIDSLSILNWPTRVQILKTFIHFKPLLCWSNAFAPWSSSLRNKYLFFTNKRNYQVHYQSCAISFMLDGFNWLQIEIQIQMSCKD